MFKQSLLLNKMTNDKFLALAWSDYLAECADNYAKLIAACTEATTLDLDNYPEEKANAIAQIKEAYELNGGESVCLANGFSTVDDVLDYLSDCYESYANIESAENMSALTEPSLQLKNNAGAVRVNAKISAASICEQLKSNLHATVVASAAFAASTCDRLADRMATLKDNIETKFSNVFDDVSNSLSYARELLGTKFSSCAEFTRDFISCIGAREQAEDDDFTVDSTDISQYSGASPLPAVDFSFAWNGIVTVGKVIGIGVWNIIKGIGIGIYKLFSWVGKKIGEIIQPYDLEVINNDADVCSVDGWKYTGDVLCSTTDITGLLPDVDVFEWQTIMSTYVGKWIKFEFFTGEVFISINHIPTIWEDHLILDCDIQFKPYPLDFNVVVPIMNDATVGGFNHEIEVTDTQNYIKFELSNKRYDSVEQCDACLADKITAIKSERYIPDIGEASEEHMFRCFQFSMCFTRYLVHVCRLMMEASPTGDFYIPADDWEVNGYNANPTNKDWVRIVSGWNGDVNNPQFTRSFPVRIDDPVSLDNMEPMFEDLAAMFADQRLLASKHPTDFPFLPYRNNVAGFSTSKYGLKTDDANQKAFTKFCTVAAAIVITAVVAIQFTTFIRRIKRNKFFKRTEFVGQMDNKMWSGKKMTYKERKKYIKYNRKLNASNLLTGGIQESAGAGLTSLFSTISSDSTNNDVLSVNNILEAIEG